MKSKARTSAKAAKAGKAAPAPEPEIVLDSVMRLPATAFDLELPAAFVWDLPAINYAGRKRGNIEQLLAATPQGPAALHGQLRRGDAGRETPALERPVERRRRRHVPRHEHGTQSRGGGRRESGAAADGGLTA
jgi:hypothetical protein